MVSKKGRFGHRFFIDLIRITSQFRRTKQTWSRKASKETWKNEGHKDGQDIVLRGLNIFDEIIIAIGFNSKKKRYFEIEYMVEKIQGCFKGFKPFSTGSYPS